MLKPITVTIKMEAYNQYHHPILSGTTVMYKGKLHTVEQMQKNTSGGDTVRLHIKPLLVIEDFLIE